MCQNKNKKHTCKYFRQKGQLIKLISERNANFNHYRVTLEIITRENAICNNAASFDQNIIQIFTVFINLQI